MSLIIKKMHQKHLKRAIFTAVGFREKTLDFLKFTFLGQIQIFPRPLWLLPSPTFSPANREL